MSKTTQLEIKQYLEAKLKELQEKKQTIDLDISKIIKQIEDLKEDLSN